MILASSDTVFGPLLSTNIVNKSRLIPLRMLAVSMNWAPYALVNHGLSMLEDEVERLRLT